MRSWSKSPARTWLLSLCTLALFACSSGDGDTNAGEQTEEDAGEESPPRRDGGGSAADASRLTPDAGARDATTASRDGRASEAPPVDAGTDGARSDERRDASADESRDAAPDGAGGGDASQGGGCSGTTLFCEDFEAVALGAAASSARWEPTGVNAELTIEEGRARGRRALHVHTTGNGRGYVSVKDFAPPGNSFFGRMHVYAAALPTAPNYAHYTLFEAAGAQPGLIRPIGGQYIEGMGNLLGAGTDGGPTGDWTNWKPSAPFEAGKWVCFEWELRAADNEIKVWIDGAARPDLTVSTKAHGGTQVDFVFPTFNRAWFGWWLYQGGPTPSDFDLWFDDLALATTRLGC